MRDLLPDEARRHRSLAERALHHFSLHGYELVTPPAFELANVLTRGLGALELADVLCFVEPESGEVAALRPDMTPQIARIVATRLARGPTPIRLAYEGTVVRKRQGRARRHRQVTQAGVELCGAPGIDGDLEVLALAASTAESLGLADAVIDVGHAAVVRSLLSSLPAALADEVRHALGQKDGASIDRLLVGREHQRVVAALADLHGGGPGEAPAAEVLARAANLLTVTEAAAPLRELTMLWERASTTPAASRLRIDLGEARGFAYYTGVTFTLLAEGPGEPIGAGGRYDELLARFDAPMPAIGFALNLDSVAWARDAAGIFDPREPRAVVAAERADEAAWARAESVVTAIRAGSIPAVVHDASTARAFAGESRFTHLVELEPDGFLRLCALGARDDAARAVALGETSKPPPRAIANIGELLVALREP